jgi:hypothetical protein
MNGISGARTGGAEGTIEIAMLKRSNDLMKNQSTALLATLPPPPRAASPSGVGGQIDIQA